jgi:hypothetical protein
VHRRPPLADGTKTESELVGHLAEEEAGDARPFPPTRKGVREEFILRRNQWQWWPELRRLAGVGRGTGGQQLLNHIGRGGGVDDRVMDREDDLCCLAVFRIGDFGTAHERTGVGIQSMSELTLGDLCPGRVIDAVDVDQRDRLGRGAEAKTAVVRLDLRAQEGVALLDRVECPVERLFDRTVAQRQHHHDVERRVRVACARSSALGRSRRLPARGFPRSQSR